MKKDILFIIIVILFLTYYVDDTFGNAEVAVIKSNIDGRKYIVRNEPDKIEAANLLANINLNNLKLIAYLKKTFPEDSRVKRLSDNYNPDAISEGTEKSKYTSYSVNKGERIVLCIRDRSTNKLVDLNTIMFVMNHELAHLLTIELNHTDTFWKNFKWLLKEAVKISIYIPEDYSKTPKKYCGITITSNILNDDDDKDKEKKM